MRERVIPFLGFSCGAIFVAYLALVVATIFFASSQTGLAASLRDAEGRVGALETEYYDALNRLSAADIATAGFATPARTDYVAGNGTPSVTLAPGTRVER